MLSPKPTLAELLTHHYLEYQKRSGGMKKLKQFAEYLEIHEVTLNRLINGKRNAGPAMLVRLGKKLEDPRFYELAMAPYSGDKNPVLDYVDRNWESAPEDVRLRIAEMLSPYTTEPIPHANEKRTKPSKS